MDRRSVRASPPSRKQALEKADAYKLALATNTLTPTTVTFEQWANNWLTTYKEGSVRDVTLERSYKGPLDKHIIPYFGRMRLSEVRPVHVQRFFQAKAGYSYSQQHKLKLILSDIFERAMENDLISKNPAKRIKLSKSADDRIKAKQAYTYDQAQIFVSFARRHPFGVGPIILIKTGMRLGELLALKLPPSTKRRGSSMCASPSPRPATASSITPAKRVSPCGTSPTGRIWTTSLNPSPGTRGGSGARSSFPINTLSPTDLGAAVVPIAGGGSTTSSWTIS